MKRKRPNTQKESSKSDYIHYKQVYEPFIKFSGLKSLDVSKHTEAEIRKILTGWQSEFDLEQGNLFQTGYL